MQRYSLALTVVLALAATTSGAEVLFFLSSPASTNGATSGAGALADGVNPVIDTSGGDGSADITLWMFLDTAEMAAGTGAGSAYGIYGSKMNLVGAGTHSVPFTVFDSGGRWSVSANAPAGADYLNLIYLTSTAVDPSTSNAGDGAALPAGLFRIADGEISWTAGETGDVYIQLKDGSSVGASSPLFVAVGGFGWSSAGGSPDEIIPDPQLDPGIGFGWILADPGLDNGITSVLPDLVFNPEPATLAFVGFALLAIQSRRPNPPGSGTSDSARPSKPITTDNP